LPCGHLIDGLCYLDSEKCIYCDIEKFLEMLHLFHLYQQLSNLLLKLLL